MIKQKNRPTQQAAPPRSRHPRLRASAPGSPVRHRVEHDSMGPVQVPADAYYGAQTQRAVENFPISGLRMPRAFIRALGLIKWAAAEVNAELGLLDPKLAPPI